MKYYTLNTSARSLSPLALPIAVDGRLVLHPTPAQAAQNGAYPRNDSAPAPTPPEGKVAVPDSWDVADGAWVRTYRFEDAPPRRWTPLGVKRACGDRWPTVKSALVAADIYEDFIMARELREDDAAFALGYAWAVSQYDAQTVDAVLAAAQEGEAQ
jgi:hypothetical protein